MRLLFQNHFVPLFCMGIVNELCGTGAKQTKNTGFSGSQCLEGLMEKPAVARDGFTFASVADFKSKDAWLEAIQNKDIVPLFDAYVVTSANTEATTYTAGNFSYETAPAVKITTFESYLGFCSHAALKSYKGSDYTQVFEFNNDGSLIGVDAGDGKVKGQDLKDFNVGIRNIATADKPAFTLVRMTYRDYNELEDNAVAVKPDFTAADIDGIYDVELSQVSATSTTIKFKATRDCGNAPVLTLTAGDIVVKNASGVTQTVSFVAADADGVYTVTGTGFANGYTVEIDGVVAVTDVLYEGVEPLTITVS